MATNMEDQEGAMGLPPNAGALEGLGPGIGGLGINPARLQLKNIKPRRAIG